MSAIKPVAVKDAHGELKDLYTHLEKKMGKVFNIFQNMGNSPLVLKAFMDLNQAAERTSIPPKIREQIALIVGEANRCHYCLSAHSAIAKGLGIPEQDILQARRGESPDAKTRAILQFTRKAVENRGNVSDKDLAEFKDAGVTDKEFVEITLLIAVNMFTNYFNLLTGTPIDFPEAPALK